MSVSCGTHRVPYKHVNQSLTRFLGVGLGSSSPCWWRNQVLVKKLIACSLSLSKSKARIGLEHQRLKEKLPDPSILLIPGLVIESTESKEKKMWYRDWTQIGTESPFMSERYMTSCVKDRVWGLESKDMHSSSNPITSWVILWRVNWILWAYISSSLIQSKDFWKV